MQELTFRFREAILCKQTYSLHQFNDSLSHYEKLRSSELDAEDVFQNAGCDGQQVVSLAVLEDAT